MGNFRKSVAILLALGIFLLAVVCVDSMPASSAQSNYAAQTFAISVVASINNYSSTCVFGVNPNSMADYFPAYDTIALRPSSGIYFYFKCPNQTVAIQRLSKFILPSNGYASWFLEVDNIDQSGTLTLTWNDTTVVSLTLEDGVSKQKDADMNAVSNFSFSTALGSMSGFLITFRNPGAPTPSPSPTPAPTPSPTPTLPPYVPIPTPAIPEFDAAWVNSSYDVPTTYTINPCTGKNETNPGYHVNNSSIVLTLLNQPFVSFIDNINGSLWNISFNYEVREKGHYEENWTNLYYAENMPFETSSQYTILTYPVQQYSNAPDSYMLGGILVQIPAGGQIDFQVEALIGDVHKLAFPLSPWVFNGQTSGWSNTQTITIPETASSTPTPAVPELPKIAILSLLIATLLVAAMLKYGRKFQGNFSIIITITGRPRPATAKVQHVASSVYKSIDETHII